MITLYENLCIFTSITFVALDNKALQIILFICSRFDCAGISINTYDFSKYQVSVHICTSLDESKKLKWEWMYWKSLLPNILFKHGKIISFHFENVDIVYLYLICALIHTRYLIDSMVLLFTELLWKRLKQWVPRSYIPF